VSLAEQRAANYGRPDAPGLPPAAADLGPALLPMCAGTIRLLQAGAAIGADRQADGGIASALGYLAIAGWFSFYFLFLSCASGFRQALLSRPAWLE
jgi:hypothetical protein